MPHILPATTYFSSAGGAPHWIQPRFCLIQAKMPRKIFFVALGGTPTPPGYAYELAWVNAGFHHVLSTSDFTYSKRVWKCNRPTDLFAYTERSWTKLQAKLTVTYACVQFWGTNPSEPPVGALQLYPSITLGLWPEIRNEIAMTLSVFDWLRAGLV